MLSIWSRPVTSTPALYTKRRHHWSLVPRRQHQLKQVLAVVCFQAPSQMHTGFINSAQRPARQHASTCADYIGARVSRTR